MEENNCQRCFLCEKSSDEMSYRYTEPICEDCLNFKGLTRIEAVIGNKRRLRNEDASSESSIKASPSFNSTSHAEIGKRNNQSSVATDYLLLGKPSISKTRSTVSDSQTAEEIQEKKKPSGVFNSSLDVSSAVEFREKETKEPECKLNTSKNDCLDVVIPLPYKEVAVFQTEDYEKNLPLQAPQFTKFQEEQKISESFAQAALGTLKCGLSCKKLLTLSLFKNAKFDKRKKKKLTLKRCRSNSSSTSRKK